MPRKPYKPFQNQRLDPDMYCLPGQVVFITLRALGRSQPFTSPPICQMVIETLLGEQERSTCTVLTYCLMPDHLHYLVEPTVEGASVLTFTDRFKGKTTNRSWALGWTGKLWQPRSYDHLLCDEDSLQAISDYILENPVRKGLAVSSAAWLWAGSVTQILKFRTAIRQNCLGYAPARQL